jgi:hypothetical protein
LTTIQSALIDSSFERFFLIHILDRLSPPTTQIALGILFLIFLLKQRQYAQRRLSVGIAILSFLIGQVAASPVVIYDSGKTINAQQFYPFQKPSVKIKNIPRYIKKSIKRFPVVSSMLSIGKVKGRKIRNRMPRAICVVGGDKRSSIWIKKNRSTLNLFSLSSDH